MRCRRFRRKPFLCLICTLACFKVYCQSSAQDSLRKERSPYSFKNRPKFLELNLSSLPVLSNSLQNSQTLNSQVEQDVPLQVDAKLYFPILLKNRLNILGRIKYQRESFAPFGEEEISDVELGLQRTELSILGEQKLQKGRFIKFIAKAALQGDTYQNIGWNRSLNVGIVGVWGFTNKQGDEWGAGLYVGSNMGRIRVLPAVSYDHQFNSKWRINLLLPKELKLAFKVKPDFRLKAGVEFQTASFLINQRIVPGYEALEYRRNGISYSLGAEKLLNDWLGFRVELGVNTPLRQVLVRPGEPSRNYVWDLGNVVSPYISIGLFALPPSKLLNFD